MTEQLVVAAIPLVEVDEATVWVQSSRSHANMLPGTDEDWAPTRNSAVETLKRYTTAGHFAHMKSAGASGIVDLGATPLSRSIDIIRTNGLITTNPEVTLYANPADCGQIALRAFSKAYETPVIGLFHADRVLVGNGDYLRAVDYLLETYDADPAEAVVRMSPSARNAYRLDYLPAGMLEDEAWHDYLSQDETGRWQVGFHDRTVDDLQSRGILAANMHVSNIDTAASDEYYSNSRYNAGLQPRGYNGVFFALRK